MNNQIYFLLSLIAYPLGYFIYFKKKYFNLSEVLVYCFLITFLFIVALTSNGLLESFVLSNVLATMHLCGFSGEARMRNDNRISKVVTVIMLRLIVTASLLFLLGIFIYQVGSYAKINFMPAKPIKIQFDGVYCLVFISVYSIWLGVISLGYVSKGSRTLLDV